MGWGRRTVDRKVETDAAKARDLTQGSVGVHFHCLGVSD